MRREQRGALGRREDGDGVVEHRRSAVDLLVRGISALSLATMPPTFGATSSTTAPSASAAAVERGEQPGVGAVGDEHAELAAGERRRSVGEDAQRRRRRRGR